MKAPQDYRTHAVGAAASIALVICCLAFAGPVAAADNFPSKPILYVVPYAPGGGTDIMVRLMDKVGTAIKAFPQPLVIENKTGGSGLVGKSYAKSKPADGYTLVAADDSTTCSDLFGNAPWPYNDFTYIAKVNVDYQMIVVRADSSFKTLKELVDAAKAKPKGLKIGGTGVAQIDPLHVAIFEKAAGIKLNYISHDSGGAVMTALLGGNIDLAIANPSEAFEQMRAGKVRSLAVSSDKRLAMSDPIWKGIPTMKEAGVNAVFSQWRGTAAPKGLPKDRQDWLISALKKITESKEWKEQYLEKFFQVGVFVPGDECRKEAEKEYAEYKAIMAEAGLLKK